MVEAFHFARARYGEALVQMRRDVKVVGLAIAISTIPRIVADIALEESAAMLLLSTLNLVDLYLTLLPTYRTLDAFGAPPTGYDRSRPTQGRYPSAFLLSLLSVCGAVLGAIFLIVPGILLFLRWSVALPALAAENLSPVGALRRSWRLTRTALGGTGLIALGFVLFIAVFVPPLLLAENARSVVFATVALDVAGSLAILFGAITWACTYLALRRAA